MSRLHAAEGRARASRQGTAAPGPPGYCPKCKNEPKTNLRRTRAFSHGDKVISSSCRGVDYKRLASTAATFEDRALPNTGRRHGQVFSRKDAHASRGACY